MLTLYYSPGACSLSPHIALCEAGLPVELVKVDLSTKQMDGGGDFRTINPKGYVPALKLDDGQILTEGPAIVQYIADQVAEKRLVPAPGTMERYRLVEWMNFISTELHKGIAPLFNPKAPEEWKLLVKEQLAVRLQYVSEQLGDKPYLMGYIFTVADGYLFTVLGWDKYAGFDISHWPTLVAYRERVAARPAVHQALLAEGLIKG